MASYPQDRCYCKGRSSFSFLIGSMPEEIKPKVACRIIPVGMI